MMITEPSCFINLYQLLMILKYNDSGYYRRLLWFIKICQRLIVETEREKFLITLLPLLQFTVAGIDRHPTLCVPQNCMALLLFCLDICIMAASINCDTFSCILITGIERIDCLCAVISVPRPRHVDIGTSYIFQRVMFSLKTRK